MLEKNCMITAGAQSIMPQVIDVIFTISFIWMLLIISTPIRLILTYQARQYMYINTFRNYSRVLIFIFIMV